MVELLFVNDAPRNGSQEPGCLDTRRHQVRSHAAAYAHRKKQAKQALQSEARELDQHKHSSRVVVNAKIDRRPSANAGRPALVSSGSTGSTDSSYSSVSSFTSAKPSSSESSISIDSCDNNNDDRQGDDGTCQDVLTFVLPHIDYGPSLFGNDLGCYHGMRTDPFNQIAPRICPLMDYLTQRVVPSLTTTLKIFNVNSWTVHGFLRLLQDKNCLYACFASVQYTYDARCAPNEPFSQDFLKMHNNGLIRLRRRLKRQRGHVDAVVVLAVIALAVTASMTGDLEAFRTHASSLPLLTRSCNSSNASQEEHFIKLLVKQWQSAWSLSPHLRGPELCQKLRHELPDFQSLPFSSRVKRLVNNLPIGFQRLARVGFLSTKTLAILARTVDAHSSRADTDFHENEQEHYYHSQRSYDDWHEACPALTNDREETKCILEAMIAQALFFYCMHTFSSVRFMGPSYVGFRAKLSLSVMLKHEEDLSAAGDVMVWIWMNLIDSWVVETGDKLLPRGVELMQSMQASFGHCDGPISMLSKLVLFFTNPEFERRCMKYWHAVEK